MQGWSERSAHRVAHKHTAGYGVTGAAGDGICTWLAHLLPPEGNTYLNCSVLQLLTGLWVGSARRAPAYCGVPPPFYIHVHASAWSRLRCLLLVLGCQGGKLTERIALQLCPSVAWVAEVGAPRSGLKLARLAEPRPSTTFRPLSRCLWGGGGTYIR